MVKQQPPTGLLRILFRLPIWLYRFKLGWLMGNRFMLIHHIGRKSGLPRYAVAEVVKYERETDVYYTVSAFGDNTQWFKNLLQTPKTTIQVGRRTLNVTASPLSPAEGGAMMVDYAQRYPTTARRLMRFLGHAVDGSDEAYYVIGRDKLRFIAFFPR